MKTIVITGANRGLGLEFAKQYSQAGWHVIACCRHPDKAAELHRIHAANPIEIIELDVSDKESIHHLPHKLKSPTIDILINNAGVKGGEEHFGELRYDDFLETLKVNSIAPVLLSQSLIHHIMKSEHPIIINISSYLGSIHLNTDTEWQFPIYRISKSALNSATKCVSLNLKNKNIIVVAMDPGWVQTDMGGSAANLTPEQSITDMRKVIDGLTLSDTGKYVRYDGSQLPW